MPNPNTTSTPARILRTQSGIYWLMLGVTPLLWMQSARVPTDSFRISGQVRQEVEIGLSDLDSFPVHPIGDIKITNHRGEERGTARALKGILLKDILRSVEFDAESPRVLSEFYLTLVASDEYRVVFSWNELFNARTGEQLFLITEKDGLSIREMEERILIVTGSDVNTGRRYVKNLREIRVGRVE